jgi:uncharacterized protein (TIGR00299 family) protein
VRIAYFDTIAGISGDMTLGACVSAGVRFDLLNDELKKLNMPGFELEASHVERSGIVATKISVLISEHDHHHRNLKDIYRIIDESTLTESVKERAKKIFQEIAVAEATVHHTTVDKIHFHELGAVDSIVDIVGVSICLDVLGVERVFSSPVRLGSGGFINTQHGTMPLPTPATIEILRDYPTVLTDIPFELTTPTGAAIIKALSSGVLTQEHLTIRSLGYGAGSREIPQIPNLLRLVVGELPPAYEPDEVVNVETNIDDMNPEVYPYVVEQLLAAGAHDAFLVPIIMKKGRPGILLSTLVERSKMDSILSILLRQTTTLGVRIQAVERKKLPRSSKEILSSFGKVTVKSVIRDGNEILVPEFEECKRIAGATNIPLIEVYRILERELQGR